MSAAVCPVIDASIAEFAVMHGCSFAVARLWLLRHGWEDLLRVLQRTPCLCFDE